MVVRSSVSVAQKKVGSNWRRVLESVAGSGEAVEVQVQNVAPVPPKGRKWLSKWSVTTRWFYTPLRGGGLMYRRKATEHKFAKSD